MNPSVTPTKHEVEGWLPMPQDVAGIVYAYLGNPFVTTWEVGKSGIIRLPITELIMAGGVKESLDFVVDWGDGSNGRFHEFNYRLSDLTHMYSAAGQYSVHITGMLGRFFFDGSRKMGLSSITSDFDNGVPVYASCEQLLCVSQWGCFQCFSGAFRGCTELNVTARDAPELKDAKDLSMMFAGCASLRKEDFSSWDTSGVTNMRDMFHGCVQFDGSVSSWSTGSVTDMSGMFAGCHLFTGDLSHWNTGCVTDMSSMFEKCASFNGDLSHWATGKVTTIRRMFHGCTSFQGGGLRSWDTSQVVDMRHAMFRCTVFNGDLCTWSTGSVRVMDCMFSGCSAFRGGDLRGWRIHRVTSMEEMFSGCRLFQGDLSSWNTGACKYMCSMFEDCSSFNGDLRRWDTKKVVNAHHMFHGCVSFNGDLSSWDMGNLDLVYFEDFEATVDCILGGKDSVIPQDFRPRRRVNRLRSGKRWRKLSRSRSRSRSY